MVLLDETPKENQDAFILSSFYYAKDLAKSIPDNAIDDEEETISEDEDIRAELLNRQVLMVPVSSKTNLVQVIYIDIYGDEFTETLTWEG